jgi:ABC-2 type transport system permease protein
VRRTLTIFRRELGGCLSAPLTYVIIAAFLCGAGILTFSAGDFFARGQADLEPFFAFQPWLYLGLVPALAMRLWATETENGTIELLFTLPIRRSEAVIGKFLAAWCIAGMALALTFPLWFTVNLLGRPDNAVILAGYGASWAMAGALLAIGEAVSAASRTRATAVIATAAVLFPLIAAGSAASLAFLRGRGPAQFASMTAAASVIRHYIPLTRGLIALPDMIYFLSLMVGSLAATAVILDMNRSE